MTKPGDDGRSWTVDELHDEIHFHVEASRRDLNGTPTGWSPLGGVPSEEEILRAVGLAVDNTHVALGARLQRGASVEIRVTSGEVYEARQRKA